MRLRIRTVMIAVAIVGVVLGWVAHVRVLVREEDDFAGPILVLEGVAVAVLLTIASAVGFVVHLVRQDEAYRARLRRNDVPTRYPWSLAQTDLPAQE